MRIAVCLKRVPDTPSRIVVGTAREKVRVASALFDLPRISRAFASGELSYSKVRSLSCVATPHNEAQLLEYAQQATAEQLYGIVPEHDEVELAVVRAALEHALQGAQ